MKSMQRVVMSLLLGLSLLSSAAIAAEAPRFFSADLQGFEEVPAISTPASGRITVRVVNEERVRWTLEYADLGSLTSQAHLHFGQPGVNGGVVIFLCSNLNGAPDGVQGCPHFAGEISGVVTSQDVVASASAQGIGPGELEKVLDALRNGLVYANVHTANHGGGEIRGQLARGIGRR